MRIVAVGLLVVIVVVFAASCRLVAGNAACGDSSDCPPSLPLCSAGTCIEGHVAAGEGEGAREGEGEGTEGEGEGEGAEGEGEGAAGEGEGEGGEGEGEGEGAAHVDVVETALDEGDAFGSFFGGTETQSRVACDDASCMIVFRDDRVTLGDGDVFGAIAQHGFQPGFDLVVAIEPGEQANPDVAADGSGGFLVAWESVGDVVEAASVESDGTTSAVVEIASDASLPALGEGTHAGAFGGTNAIAWIGGDGHVHAVQTNGASTPASSAIVDLGAAASVRPAVASLPEAVGVLYVDPQSHVRFTRIDPATNTFTTIDVASSAGARLSLAAGAPGSDSWAAGVSGATSFDSFTIDGSTVTPVDVNTAAIAAFVTSDGNGGFAVAFTPSQSTPRYGALGVAAHDLGGPFLAVDDFACGAPGCAMSGPQFSQGIQLVRVTLTTSGGVFNAAGAAARAQDFPAIVELPDGSVVVAFIERSDGGTTGPHLFTRAFDPFGFAAAAPQDLGPCDDAPPALGTDGARVVVAALTQGATHVAILELDPTDAHEVAGGSTSIPTANPLAIVVTPVGNTGAIVLGVVDTTHHARAFVDQPPSFTETPLPSPANDAGTGPITVATVGAQALFAWTQPNDALQVAAVAVDGSDATIVNNGGAHLKAPALAARASGAVLVGFDVQSATTLHAFAVDAQNGVGITPIANVDVNADRFALTADRTTNVATIAARDRDDPTSIATLTIAVDGTVAVGNTLVAPRPPLSLAVVGASPSSSGYVAYHRFVDELLSDRAFMAPLP